LMARDVIRIPGTTAYSTEAMMPGTGPRVISVTAGMM
jgi:hypothetical protein